MTSDEEPIHRRLVVIATGSFAAFPKLDVDIEVTVVRAWLTDPALDDRAFSTAGEDALAAGPSYDDIRARFTGDGKFTEADALVVYITGHGVIEGGRHYLALHDSVPGEVARSAVPTADLLAWLGSYKDLLNVFVVIDVCQAGAVTNEVNAELMRDLPRTWCVLATVPATVDAKVGAFTSVLSEVLEDIRNGRVEGVDEQRPYIKSSVLIEELMKRLHEQHGQRLMPLMDPYATTACMPNPSYDATKRARATAAEERADLALLKSEIDPIWAVRAPVVAVAGATFTGRRALLDKLIGFVDGPPGALVVAGRAGSGKSAALARVVTCSDAAFRAEYDEQLRDVSPLPAEGSVDVAIVATGKTPHQLAQRLAALLHVAPPPEDDLDSYIRYIQAALKKRATPATVVIDALDEATDPYGALMTVLVRIVEGSRADLRIVVGVRSSGGGASSQSGELADLASALLGGRRVDVDSDSVWEAGDLRDYAAQVLASGQEPTQHQREMAQVVAGRAERSFLLAGLVAQQLASRQEGVELHGPDLDDLVDQLASRSIRDLVVADIRAHSQDPDQSELALLLLRAAAMSFGRGIPVRDLWATAATAIAATNRRVTQDDVAWFLRDRSSGYLLRDVEDDEVVYRPFHDLLRTELTTLGTDGTDQEMHSRVTEAFLSAYVEAFRAWLPPYMRRHLVSHASRGDRLDEVLTPRILPWLDYNRVSEETRLKSAAAPASWALLRAWRSVRHRWSWDDPAANAGALDVALLEAGWPTFTRHLPGYNWQPLWADWLAGGTVVGSAEGVVPTGVFGWMAGKRVLFASRGNLVWIWEAATGNKIGEPLQCDDDVEALAAVDEWLICLSRDGEVTVWNPAFRRVQSQVHLPGNAFRDLTAGYVDGEPAFVTAGDQGVVHVCAASNGLPLREPLSWHGWVRAVDLHDGLVAAGGSDGSVAVWDLDNGETNWWHENLGLEVNSVALESDPSLGTILVVGTSEPSVLFLGLDPQQLINTWRFQSGDEVSSVATVQDHSELFVAAATLRGEVWLGEPTSEAPDLLPHAPGVRAVEFGEVDGRAMLATTSYDGNTRLWDPRQPASARAHARDQVRQVTLLNAGAARVHVVGALEDRVAHWGPDAARSELALELPPRRQANMKVQGGSLRICAGWLHNSPVLLTVASGTADLWRLDLESGGSTLIATVSVGSEGNDRFGVDLFVGRGRVLVGVPFANDVVVTDVMADNRVHLRRDATSFPSSSGFIDTGGEVLYVVRSEHQADCFDPLSGNPVGVPFRSEGAWDALASGRLGGRATLALLGHRVSLLDISTRQPTGPFIDLPSPAKSVAWAGTEGSEVLLTAHHATARAWSPRTGRQLAELPFGTAINDLACATGEDGSITVYVAGPGVVASRFLPPLLRTSNDELRSP